MQLIQIKYLSDFRRECSHFLNLKKLNNSCLMHVSLYAVFTETSPQFFLHNWENKKLSYRTEIARQLRTQYVEGI